MDMATDRELEIAAFYQKYPEFKTDHKTTFAEMLNFYHRYSSPTIRVQDVQFSTKGSYTSPKGKYIPNDLKPWSDFEVLQQAQYQKLRAALPTQRLFEPEIGIKVALDKLNTPLSSENAVRIHASIAVETTVRDIMKELLQDHGTKATLKLKEGFKFEDHKNSLGDSNEEVRGRAARPELRQSIPVDQYSIVERTDGVNGDGLDTKFNEILFLIEYKAAHKLTSATLQRVLNGQHFNIGELINSSRVPADEEGKQLHRSKIEAAAAISQLFSYMVQNGTEYGYITTGQSYLFLHVKENEPTSAYFHLAVPNEDVTDDSSKSAVSRVLCFSLLALDSKPLGQEWIRSALEVCQKWITNEEKVVEDMSPGEESREPEDSGYYSLGSELKSSYGLRSGQR